MNTIGNKVGGISRFADLRFLLVLYFASACIFPSFRLFTVGQYTASNFWEYFISMIPDLFTLIILIVACKLVVDNKLWYKIEVIDKVVFCYFIFNVVAGFIIAQDFRISVYGFRLTYLPMIFYFFARVASSLSNFNSDNFWKSVFQINIALVVTGVVLYFFFPHWVTYMMKLGNYKISVYFIPRLTSILWSTIFFASVAASTLLFIYFKILNSQKSGWLYLAFTITFMSLLLTVSRGGIISFFIGYFILSAIYRNLKAFSYSFILMLGVAVFLKVYLFKDMFGVISWVSSSVAETLEYNDNLTRVQLWRLSFQDFLDCPWGYGLGKAGHIANRFLMNSSIKAAVFSTDGWYLKLVNESGIQGFLFFIVMLFFYFKKVVLDLVRSIRSISSFYLVSVVAVVLQCIVSNVLDFYYFAPFFWMLIGFSVTHANSFRNATEPT